LITHLNRTSSELASNVNHILLTKLSSLLGQGNDETATSIVFYSYAVLCSQVYLDEFEGALFTVNRPDMRPRIPIVNDANIFSRLVELGRKVAELEKRDYAPRNLAGFDYDALKAQVPRDFRLSWTRAIQPFDEDNETVTLTDGHTEITVHCPLDAQRLNIAGYEVIKNAWMKFNSYNFTHCAFTADDMVEFLDLINKLLEYVQMIGEIDVVMHDVIEGRIPLIPPDCDGEPQ
jgi:predicted helicase